jgi:CHAD domain-containing protein
LDGEAYRAFLKRYEKILTAKGKRVSGIEATPPPLVQHTLPGKLWEQYALVRAFESILPWADVPLLHTLRIEAKRLRYALEFFREVLPANANACIQTVVALQDHLGELNDADVALARVRAFLVLGAQTQLAPEAMQAASRYLAAQQTRLQQLRRTVGRPWRKIVGKRFKQILAKATAGL